MELHDASTGGRRSAGRRSGPARRSGSAWQRPLRAAGDAPCRGAWRRAGRSRPGSPRHRAPDDRALPTVVDVHGGPLGRLGARAAHRGDRCSSRAGYRVVLPEHPRLGDATARAWIRPQLGDWGGVDAADVHAALDHVIGLGLADPDRLGVLGLSYGGFMVNWLVGTSDRFRGGRVGERRHEPGLRLGQLRHRSRVRPGVRCSATRSRRRASTKLWRQSPLRHVGDDPDAAADAPGARPTCAARRTTTSSCSSRSGTWAGPWSTSSTPTNTTCSPRRGRPDRRIDRQTRMLAWFDRYLRAYRTQARRSSGRGSRAAGPPPGGRRAPPAGATPPAIARPRGREPADEEPGVERVAGAGRVGRLDVLWSRPRSGAALAPSRASTVAPFAPRLTTAIGATRADPRRRGGPAGPRPRPPSRTAGPGATSR